MKLNIKVFPPKSWILDFEFQTIMFIIFGNFPKFHKFFCEKNFWSQICLKMTLPALPPLPPLTMLVIWFLFEALQIYLADFKFRWLLCLCVCLFVWWCHGCNFVTEINFINIVKGGGGRGLGLKNFSNQSKTLSDL